jgi:hypothetical protein
MRRHTARVVPPTVHAEVSQIQIHPQPDGRVVLEATVWSAGERSQQVLIRLAKHAYADLEFALLRHYEGYITGFRERHKTNPNFPIREKARRP